MNDEQFAESIERAFSPEKWYYSTVAGTHHRNEDGTSRARIIARCEEGEFLRLIPEPDNPYDPNAQRVLRSDTGEQLGYVEARSAAEIARDLKRGYLWVAVLRHHNFHPDTERIVGAVIALICLRTGGGGER